MSKELGQWEQDFQTAARADDCAVFREHLKRLGQLSRPDEPQLMLEATIRIVQMCSAYATMDGRAEKFSQFLNMQKYNPSEASDARYVFTFDLWEKAFARVLVETKVQTLDLADLYGSPWPDYKVVGFNHLWISHPDWTDLTNDELLQLEDVVTDDLRFDYAEDELEFWFDDSLDETYLFVTLQDVYESEDESTHRLG
ncbi:MAG: hypothetical protein LBK67_05955 [Coriobacteriales bacterium]|jgi:hypothetical protein|nr:hypothetical protein [Coriobacteriales bacterium]